MAERSVSLDKRAKLVIPCHPTDCVAFAALDLLFSSLSVANVVKLWSLAILEKQIVILSGRVTILTLSVLVLRDLMRPFEYRGTFLPLLPSETEYLTVLDSPLPFILGVIKRDGIVIPGHLCIVDLDSNVVTDPDASPLVADANLLVSGIEAVFSANPVRLPPRTVGTGTQRRLSEEYMAEVRKRQHPYSYPVIMKWLDCQLMFTQGVANEIIRLFERHLAPRLAELLKPCFITDMTEADQPVTVFNRDVFLASVRDDQREFWGAFLHTTMFHEFSDRLMDGNMRQFGSRGSSEVPTSVSTFMDDYIEFSST
jgi:hypothetical protein